MFAILFVVLRRHARLIELAASTIVDEAEFSKASVTIDNILEAFKGRMTLLKCES